MHCYYITTSVATYLDCTTNSATTSPTTSSLANAAAAAAAATPFSLWISLSHTISHTTASSTLLYDTPHMAQMNASDERARDLWKISDAEHLAALLRPSSSLVAGMQAAGIVIVVATLDLTFP